MPALLEEAQTETSESATPGMMHIYCEDCHPNGDMALCSTPLYGESTDDDEVDCVVCASFNLVCPECHG